MAKRRKAQKFPKELFVEWSDRSDPNSADDPYLTISEEPPSEENDAIQVALYKFDRMVTVENKTTVKG